MSELNKKYKILVVDDDPNILTLLELRLGFREFNVRSTMNGRECLQLAKEYRPDVIILDVILPDIKGHDVCRMLKENTSLKHIPIIILSARSDIREKVEGLNVGAHDYVVKPFDFEELLARVYSALRTKITHDELMIMTTLDPLTKAYNRRKLEQALEEEMSRVSRYGGCFSFLLMDLDRFKAVNDRFGHITGDEVLKGFTDIIRQTLRKVDILCRYGGEEFALLLPETSVEGGTLLAERIRKAVSEKEFLCGTTPFRVTVSIGVTGFPNPELKDYNDVVDSSDKALFKAKEKGRNRVVIDSHDTDS